MFDSVNLEDFLRLFAPLVIVQFSLMIFCLYKLKNDKVRYLPKWMWGLIIIFFNFIGPILYLVIGRERD